MKDVMIQLARFGILLILTICPATFAQSPTPDHFVEVPFDFYRNEIILQVMMNGRGPYQMLLDTGTNPSAVDLTTAKGAGLKLASIGRKGEGGGTGTNLTYSTRLPVVAIGGLAVRNVEALAIDFSRISQRLGRPIHGALGHSLLTGRIVQIDYPHRLVRFYSTSPFAGSAHQTNTANRAVLKFHYYDDVLIDDVRVNGKKIVGNLDTGSNGTFQLTPLAVSVLGLDDQVSKAPASSSIGYNGEATNKEGQIERVEIGGISVDAPTVIFFGKGTGRDKKPWGINIGNGFLKDFVVTIDYRNRLITLERSDSH